MSNANTQLCLLYVRMVSAPFSCVTRCVLKGSHQRVSAFLPLGGKTKGQLAYLTSEFCDKTYRWQTDWNIQPLFFTSYHLHWCFLFLIMSLIYIKSDDHKVLVHVLQIFSVLPSFKIFSSALFTHMDIQHILNSKIAAPLSCRLKRVLPLWCSSPLNDLLLL